MGNKRIAKNTIMLYFRQILVLLVSLYTVRVVLDILGVEDYGIYNVIGGFVALFSFLKATMESATQRYFSYALGEKNEENLKKVFSINLIIYSAIGFLGVILLETIGLWFVENKINIPYERLNSAIIVFHFSVATFFVTIMSTPFISMVIAHEDMHIYAYVAILEVFLKLLAVILLQYIVGDKLALYSGLLFLGLSLTTFTYAIISFIKYKECQFKEFFWDKNLFKNITKFTSWTLFGQLTSVSRNQAMIILINQMFSPIMVTAQAIATSISSQIFVFANSFNKSLYPPIIKAYASNDKKNMFFLIYNGCKVTFFLMWLFTLPFLLEMEMIMQLWLKNIPAYAVLFTSLALMNVLINSLSQPISTAARAPGNMKRYELILGLIQFLIFFLSWIVLKLGAKAYSIYLVAFGVNILMFIVRLYLVKNLIGLDISFFLKKVLYPIFKVVLITTCLGIFIQKTLPVSFLYSMINIMLNIFLIIISIYFLGLDKNMKIQIKNILIYKFSNILNKLR